MTDIHSWNLLHAYSSISVHEIYLLYVVYVCDMFKEAFLAMF